MRVLRYLNILALKYIGLIISGLLIFLNLGYSQSIDYGPSLSFGSGYFRYETSDRFIVDESTFVWGDILIELKKEIKSNLFVKIGTGIRLQYRAFNQVSYFVQGDPEYEFEGVSSSFGEGKRESKFLTFPLGIMYKYKSTEIKMGVNILYLYNLGGSQTYDLYYLDNTTKEIGISDFINDFNAFNIEYDFEIGMNSSQNLYLGLVSSFSPSSTEINSLLSRLRIGVKAAYNFKI